MSDPAEPLVLQPMANPSPAKPQDLRALVVEMAQWRQAPEKGVHLIVVSLASALPEAKRTRQLIDAVLKTISPVVTRRNGRLFQVSPSDYAVFLKTSDMAILSFVRDTKIETLKAIDRCFPGTFSTIDQSRLILSYDLSNDYRSAAGRIAKYSEISQSAPSETSKKRGLSEADIQKVMIAYSKFGSDKFIKAFVKSQDAVVYNAGRLDSGILEFYFSIDSIRKPLFANVDMRGLGRLFNEFTLTLDQIMLSSVRLLPLCTGPWSLNLNVESIFTEPFEEFLATVPPEKLKHLLVEFRQSNIMENFDSFEAAKSLIKSKGAGIIVDQIYPATAGLVDLSEFGATYCKINWQEGSEDVLKQRGRAIKHMQDSNVKPILARVDAPRALEIGAELGIELYQGYLLDDMRKPAAA
jgi:hypothetical protein